MKFSFLQLNTYAGTYWENLVSFISSHNYDVLHLQEMAGKESISGAIHSHHDTYNELQQLLKEKYTSELAISHRFSSNPSTSYMGNAIFYKKQFTIKEKHILPLYQH